MEKIAQELIEKGAKIDVRDEFSESLDLLLIVAANAKMDKVVSALLGKGADPNRRNNEKKKLTWWQWFLSFFYTMVNEGVARKVAESLWRKCDRLLRYCTHTQRKKKQKNKAKKIQAKKRNKQKNDADQNIMVFGILNAMRGHQQTKYSEGRVVPWYIRTG